MAASEAITEEPTLPPTKESAAEQSLFAGGIDAFALQTLHYYENDATASDEARQYFIESAQSFLAQIESCRGIRWNTALPGERLSKLGDSWQAFYMRRLAAPFREAAESALSQGRRLDSGGPLLHYPLFAQRQVLSALRTLDRQTFCELVCAVPAAAFPAKQLWDICGRSQSHRRDYYGYLAEALAGLLRPGEKYLPQTTSFLSAVCSPYLDYRRKEEFFEFEHEVGPREAKPLFLTSVTEALFQYCIREDQCDMRERRNGTLVPPFFTVQALHHLSLLWRRQQSRTFFNALPRLLLDQLAIAHPEHYRALLLELGLDDRTAQQSLAAAARQLAASCAGSWPPIEFSEVDRLEHCRRALMAGASEATNGRDEALRRALLLTELQEQIQLGLGDAHQDLRRLHAVEIHIRSRIKRHPWEAEILQRELAALDVQRAKAKEQWMTLEVSRGSVEEQYCLGLARLSEGERTTEPFDRDDCNGDPLLARAVHELRETVSKLLPETIPAFKRAFISLATKDPFAAAMFDIPDHYGKVADEIRRELSAGDYASVRSRRFEQAMLVDVVEIDRLLESGKSLAQVRKRFANHLVDAVMLRNRRRREERTYAELDDIYPHLKTPIAMLAGREELEGTISLLAAEIDSRHCRVCRELEQTRAIAALGPVNRMLIFLSAADLVWRWSTAAIRNPYAIPREDTLAGRNAGDPREQKQSKFLHWLELKLSEALEESGSSMHEALLLGRPAAVLGLPHFFEFTWNKRAAKSRYTLTLARKFHQLTCGLPAEKVRAELRTLFERTPSAYIPFREFDRYEVEWLSESMLLIDPVQRRRLTSEARRAVIVHWVDLQDRLLYGTSEKPGALAAQVMNALAEIDRPYYDRLLRTMADCEQLKVYRRREALRGRLPAASAFEEVMLMRQLSREQFDFEFLSALRTIIGEAGEI